MARNPYTWKYFVNDYFIFSKGQRRAFVVLLFLIFISLGFPYAYNAIYGKEMEKADPIIVEEIKGLEARDSFKQQINYNQNPGDERKSFKKGGAVSHGPLFYFDPNTISADQWKQLGIRDKTIETILKYRLKGGKFYMAADLQKIYGLHSDEVERLTPFVKINIDISHPPTSYSYSKESKPGYNSNKQNSNRIEINTADTTAFKSLPGIGSKLAERIIKYRDALGGFYSITQVSEVYGIRDTTFDKIKELLFVKSVAIKKRNINTVDLQQLRMPYIPNNVANAIIQYREKNGRFSSVDQLKNIPIIDDDLFLKIEPYLTIE